MKDVVGFATGHNAVEVYDPASGVTVSVASYCSTALVDLDYKTLLEGACKLTSDPGFELVVFNKVWRSLITNDYAYEEESAKAEALSKVEVHFKLQEVKSILTSL